VRGERGGRERGGERGGRRVEGGREEGEDSSVVSPLQSCTASSATA